MASKLKQGLFKYVMELEPLKSITGDLEKVKPRLILNTGDQNKIGGNIQLDSFPSVENENMPKFSDFKLHQNKIVIGGLSRQVDFTRISPNGSNLHFELDTPDFVKDVLDSDPTEVTPVARKKKFLVEFSSPNIAKLFHVGHLRSTMMGNFISNILKKTGNDVVRINYLGDWGTQFGLQITGLELLGYNEESLQTDTITKLSKAYVHANKMAEKDEGIGRKAREIFQKLENGDEEMMRIWQKIKEWSTGDLEQMYRKLNVEFDEYEWESSYSGKKAGEFVKRLEEIGVVSKDELGRKTVEINGEPVPLLKSDGTTLYLLRDVQAFFDRRKRHQFDESYYVVDYSQGKHFTNLKGICELIEPGSSDMITHVQIGRILKMKTRAGTGIILRDLLHEAAERMLEKQKYTSTTKGPPNMETSEALAIGAVIIHDLKQGREKHYEFKWDAIFSSRVDVSSRIQYAHCRLCNVIKNSGREIANECDPSVLTEAAVVRLVLDIAGFDDAVHLAQSKLEPSILTAYLFRLSSSANNAIGSLPVKKADPYIGSQRLCLFNKSKLVIAEGLRLLGVNPLEEM